MVLTLSAAVRVRVQAQKSAAAQRLVVSSSEGLQGEFIHPRYRLLACQHVTIHASHHQLNRPTSRDSLRAILAQARMVKCPSRKLPTTMSSKPADHRLPHTTITSSRRVRPMTFIPVSGCNPSDPSISEYLEID